MTTHELDEIGRMFLEFYGAHSAPKIVYNFPGTTCIGLNHEAAHGVYGKRFWNEQKILQAIQHRILNNKDLSNQTLIMEDISLLRAATKYFGSWPKALAIARASLSDSRILPLTPVRKVA